MTHHVHVSPMDQASLADKAWLAGLLEGEGCFPAVKSPTPLGRCTGAVELSMTDEDVVRHVANLMGTPVHRLTGRRSAWQCQDQYQCHATGVRARRVMEEVLPYMGERRASKIIELLAMPNWGFPDSHRTNKPRKGLTCRQ